MNVLVNKSSILNEVKKCDGYVQEFEEATSKLQKTVSDIESIWKKEEYEQFRLKMNDFVKDLDQFKDQLDSYNRFVQGYVDTESLLEQEYATKKIEIE